LEDIAVLGAALLVVNSMVTLPWAAASQFRRIGLAIFGLYVSRTFWASAYLKDRGLSADRQENRFSAE